MNFENLPVTPNHHLNAASYNGLDEVRRIYIEHFHPAVMLVMEPSPFEELLQAHAIRGLAFMRAIDRMDGQAFFQSLIASIRTLFEMTVDVQLICNAQQLSSPCSNDEVVERHRVFQRCQRLKLMYAVAQNLPGADPDVAKQASRRVAENEPSLDLEAARLFGVKRAHAVEHWHTQQLAKRVQVLDATFKCQRWQMWHKIHYSIASVYTHGSLGHGTANADADLLFATSSMLYNWCVEFLAEHFMKPVLQTLKLDKAHPGAWESVLGARRAAARRIGRFLDSGAEIWAAERSRAQQPDTIPRPTAGPA